MKMRRRKWSGLTSGANIPSIRVYICEACHGWFNGKKPKQCIACGSLTFTHFPSKAEARRYGELRLEQKYGLIAELELQPRFPLHGVNDYNDRVKIGEYRGDFRYKRKGKTIIEDVKGGADTPLSAWKRKHAEAEYGIKIEIVKR